MRQQLRPKNAICCIEWLLRGECMKCNTSDITCRHERSLSITAGSIDLAFGLDTGDMLPCGEIFCSSC
jgi:hypothetical protein